MPASHISKQATRQRFAATDRLARHRHDTGYIAVVVSGGYVEAGDAGRFHLRAGHAVVHQCFEAHADQFGAGGAVVLNLPLPGAASIPPAVLLEELDAVVRTAERDPLAAARLVIASRSRPAPAQADWPDLLAAALRDDPLLLLAEWAEASGMAPETLSRGFKRAYGVSPKAYRAQVRALTAWRRIPSSPLPLAQLAAELGFADQAHMTRDVHALCGRTPTALRR
ncbi:helix-turn-helix domain-containing protein [Archangium lansingense]|uniref:helix-turn-helix domain-containing protein n=1 Tax=Archangium lansingense TaxID=2995310 RepID=UPI003B7BE2F8